MNVASRPRRHVGIGCLIPSVTSACSGNQTTGADASPCCRASDASIREDEATADRSFQEMGPA
jgi:hypothetical protein